MMILVRMSLIERFLEVLKPRIMIGSMTFIDLRETVLDELRMIEMHDIPELIL